ncbi:MAG: response regulator transcription factor [Alphaproteobacteria bacterium]|nr:response regulator transcription factor [Alphaproteobacteria bacterium]
MDGSGASASPHVLVVDDDKRLCTLLARFLGAQGFRVTTAASSDEARTRLRSFAFDLIVLDVMLPGESGLELTQSLRAESAVPILLLTARGDPEDRIEGLERGADDYLAKPFEPRELVARIRSVLRRVRPQPTPSQPLRFGDVRFDAERALLLRGSNPLRLSTAEAKMLQRLALSGGEPVSREELSAISGAGGNLRSVDVQIARLRRKIEPDPRLPRYLQTVRGQGYALRPD